MTYSPILSSSLLHMCSTSRRRRLLWSGITGGISRENSAHEHKVSSSGERGRRRKDLVYGWTLSLSFFAAIAKRHRKSRRFPQGKVTKDDFNWNTSPPNTHPIVILKKDNAATVPSCAYKHVWQGIDSWAILICCFICNDVLKFQSQNGLVLNTYLSFYLNIFPLWWCNQMAGWKEEKLKTLHVCIFFYSTVLLPDRKDRTVGFTHKLKLQVSLMWLSLQRTGFLFSCSFPFHHNFLAGLENIWKNSSERFIWHEHMVTMSSSGRGSR